jgi:hypothetical protein
MKPTQIKKTEKIVNHYYHYHYDRKSGKTFTISGIVLENTRAVVKPKYRMLMGVAACSKKDRFVKRVGRSIASGRAVVKPLASVTSRQKILGADFIRIVYTEIFPQFTGLVVS